MKDKTVEETEEVKLNKVPDGAVNDGEVIAASEVATETDTVETAEVAAEIETEAATETAAAADIAEDPEEELMQRHSYGDLLVDEFSAEHTVEKVTKAFKLPDTTVGYIFSVIYLLVGVACVAFTKHIGNVFSYIVGAFMAVLGLTGFISAIYRKEYRHTHSNKTAMSLVLMILSVMILVERDSANIIVAIGWGFFGLLEGAHALNHAFSRIANGQRCIYYIAKGMIELVLAFLLLHDPIHHLTLHIFVFGLNLIFDSIAMFPPLKKYLSRK